MFLRAARLGGFFYQRRCFFMATIAAFGLFVLWPILWLLDWIFSDDDEGPNVSGDGGVLEWLGTIAFIFGGAIICAAIVIIL